MGLKSYTFKWKGNMKKADWKSRISLEENAAQVRWSKTYRANMMVMGVQLVPSTIPFSISSVERLPVVEEVYAFAKPLPTVLYAEVKVLLSALEIPEVVLPLLILISISGMVMLI
jgi:hypothetical protein